MKVIYKTELNIWSNCLNAVWVTFRRIPSCENKEIRSERINLINDYMRIAIPFAFTSYQECQDMLGKIISIP
jgi:hypothetical protein